MRIYAAYMLFDVGESEEGTEVGENIYCLMSGSWKNWGGVKLYAV